MRRNWKKIVATCLCVTMLFGLCACDNSEWIFSLNGEKLYDKDVAAFGYIYATEYNIKDEEQLDEIYENATTYGEYYKEQLEEDIISTVLLYKEAKDNRVKLSDETKKQIDVNIEKVLERFGEESLEKSGVSRADIENVYEMKLLGDTYLNTLSGAGEQEGVEASKNEAEEERYIKVYQVTFPTVELDDDGMVQSDAEGQLKKIAAYEISEKEQEALSFAEAAKQGADMETLLKEYDATVTGIEKYLKYNDLEKNYKSAVDTMSVGDVSDVIESDYGFYVIRLLTKNDTSYAETMGQHEKETEVLSAKEDLLDELYSEYADANKEYKNTDKWNTIEMKNYLK